MSRHYPPATEGEMDRLLLIAPPMEPTETIVMATANPAPAPTPTLAELHWRRDRGDDGTEDVSR